MQQRRARPAGAPAGLGGARYLGYRAAGRRADAVLARTGATLPAAGRARPEPPGRGGGMKGVVLAGGLGTRLMPMTRVTNKHLLPVYDRPMIFYPMQTLVGAGISEILVVTGGNNAGDFLRLLGNGHELGLRRLHYAYQEGEGGIAEALGLAEDFAEGEPVCVIL